MLLKDFTVQFTKTQLPTKKKLLMEIGSVQLENERESSTFESSVERISYFNQETGQCILEVKDLTEGNSFYVSGKLPWVYPGMKLSGTLLNFVADRNIWRAKDLVISLPENERGLKKFLRSEALIGFGPKLIKLLVKAYPKNLLSIIEHSPDDLLKVAGIGHKKKNQIVSAWSDFQKRTEFQSFLFQEYFPLNWFSLIWPHHGKDSLRLLKESPYAIGSKHQLSFELIDGYALKNGFALDSVDRLRFGFRHVLWNFYKQGHCAYPEQKVLEEATKLLEAPKDQLEEILELEIIEDKIIVDTIRGTDCLYFKEVWDLERHVAKMLFHFQHKEPPWGWFNADKVLGWAQEILNIKLAPLQKEAIETALSSAMTVVTGGPGTGKTTLIQSLVTILQTQFLKFALCSPTGRAAQRLGEATRMPAQTIHRLLKFDGGTGKFIHNRNNPLNLDLVLVDEASMVDLGLMADLLDALPEKCALILVGDADQIPSVGAGNVLHSIISSPLFRIVRLKEIYRQKEHSLIKENAHRINTGLMPLMDPGSDFQYIPVAGAEETKAIVHHLMEHVIPEKCGINNIEEMQILVPLNQGTLSAQSLNEEIQKKILHHRNYSVNNSPSVADYGYDFRIGDKVMVIKNDYKKDVFNGDIGFIEQMNYDLQYLEINFSGRPVRFEFYEMDRLTLAYAISIHKSQGSEYRAVIVVITEEHLPLVQRHLVYTAVTRGKEFVFLVAEPSALKKALQAVEPRWENLTALLKPEKNLRLVKNTKPELSESIF
jgi:exodeoxyribonuclease V alpha subunit